MGREPKQQEHPPAAAPRARGLDGEFLYCCLKEVSNLSICDNDIIWLIKHYNSSCCHACVNNLQIQEMGNISLIDIEIT